MGDPSNVAPEGMMEWLGHDGQMRVGGVDYDLREMDGGELNDLHAQLATDATFIRRALDSKEVEREMVGDLDFNSLDWRRRARFACAIKKKMIMAIHTEFARRKSLTPPLSEFAWEAVIHVVGEEFYDKVYSEALGLQAAHVARMMRVRQRGLRMTRQAGSRAYVCGIKIQHESDEDALAAIDQMEADGLDVTDLKVYPCPWCFKVHVGHDPNRKAKRRKKLRKMQQQEAEVPA